MAQYARRHKRRHYDRNFMLSGLADKARPVELEPIEVERVAISDGDAALIEVHEHMRLELATMTMVGEGGSNLCQGQLPDRPRSEPFTPASFDRGV